jgi:hypothetical protein
MNEQNVFRSVDGRRLLGKELPKTCHDWNKKLSIDMSMREGWATLRISCLVATNCFELGVQIILPPFLVFKTKLIFN